MESLHLLGEATGILGSSLIPGVGAAQAEVIPAKIASKLAAGVTESFTNCRASKRCAGLTGDFSLVHKDLISKRSAYPNSSR